MSDLSPIESFDLNHVQARKVARLIEDENAFRYRVLFELGPEWLDSSLGDILKEAHKRIDLEKKRKQLAHWTFSSGRLTGLIQVAASASARLAKEVADHRTLKALSRLEKVA